MCSPTLFLRINVPDGGEGDVNPAPGTAIKIKSPDALVYPVPARHNERLPL